MKKGSFITTFFATTFFVGFAMWASATMDPVSTKQATYLVLVALLTVTTMTFVFAMTSGSQQMRFVLNSISAIASSCFFATFGTTTITLIPLTRQNQNAVGIVATIGILLAYARFTTILRRAEQLTKTNP